MQVTVEKIKELRERTGVGIMDCKKALAGCEGNLDIALAKLRDRGFAIAQKKKNRALKSGVVESYVHGAGRIGVLVEVNCESDFVARTSDFRELSHDLAMQIAACCPENIYPDEVPTENGADCTCLLHQPFIKDPQKTVEEVILDVIARVGENIRVNRFTRFELGD